MFVPVRSLGKADAGILTLPAMNYKRNAWRTHTTNRIHAETTPADLELTGDGWNTSTSMPWCRASTARAAPKLEMKLLVAAYSEVKGDTMEAAAEEVKTMQPRSCLATCAQKGGTCFTMSHQSRCW